MGVSSHPAPGVIGPCPGPHFPSSEIDLNIETGKIICQHWTLEKNTVYMPQTSKQFC